MTAPFDYFSRVSSYGQPVIRGLAGPLWRHHCGLIESVDLIERPHVRPWLSPCAACGHAGKAGWQPLYAFTGACCDQCDGNGWVPIAGRVDGALSGFETVTGCVACGGSGMAVTR